MTDCLKRLEDDIAAGKISVSIGENLALFYASYRQTLESEGMFDEKTAQALGDFHTCVINELAAPHAFSPFHRAERAPFDFYALGMDLFRPLVKQDDSIMLGTERIPAIIEQLGRGENVIFLANHQAEADPQAISLMLEKQFPDLAESMAFVAGHRVTTDPLAIPISRGRHLFCVYSKRHIENPPDQKQSKQLHNQTTMRIMSEKLRDGGLCIYVAPSGGRDRLDANGRPFPALFDAQSIEMFRLMANKAETPTHFYPMSLFTYDLLPPPETIIVELGEQRHTKRSRIGVAVGNEIDMDSITTNTDKKRARQERAEAIWNLVNQGYQQLLKE